MAISLVRRIETEHRNERTTDQTGVHDAAEFALRHKLFDELLKKEEFMDAANCLGKLNLDATSGKVFCVCICIQTLPCGLFLPHAKYHASMRATGVKP